MINKDPDNIQTLKKNMLPKSDFLNCLRIEQQRADRSKAPLSVALFSFRQKENDSGTPLLEFLKSLHKNTRETDIKGWVNLTVGEDYTNTTKGYVVIKSGDGKKIHLNP